MKKHALLLIALFVASVADAEHQLVTELRKAGERLGFQSVTQIRASYSETSGKMIVDRFQIDLATGNSRQIIKDALADSTDPLAEEIAEESLVTKGGNWRTSSGTLYLNAKTGKWSAVHFPPRDSTESHLAMLSPEWVNLYAQARPGDTGKVVVYPPVTVGDKVDYRPGLKGGEFDVERTIKNGLIIKEVFKHWGVVVSRQENHFEGPVDLTPSPEEQKTLETASLQLPPIQPLNPTALPTRVFGFSFMRDPEVAALRVVDVTPGSPAEKQGLKSGDLLTKINGTPIADLTDPYRTVLAGLEVVNLSVENPSGTREVRLEKVERSSFLR